MLEYEKMQEVLAEITEWFSLCHRPLPWRDEPSPYHVWISEIMLQQTRIEAVIPYYFRFLERLPDIPALASCDEELLLKLWEGLGYYSRARNLKKAALQIMEQYGGQLPESAKELRKLSGIGEYTAGAIASIAFGQPEPAVDGNVLRVLSRITLSSEDVMLPAVRKAMSDSLKNLYPSGKRAGLLTQGLMELGEVICIPNGRPKCEACPVRGLCLAHKEGREEEFPVRSEKRARRVEQLTVLLLERSGRFAVKKRPGSGLLAGMWEFPNCPGILTEQDILSKVSELGLKPLSVVPAGKGKHIFTHVEWHMTGQLLQCGDGDASLEELLWLTPEEIRTDYALPTAFRKWQEIIEKETGNK